MAPSFLKSACLLTGLKNLLGSELKFKKILWRYMSAGEDRDLVRMNLVEFVGGL